VSVKQLIGELGAKLLHEEFKKLFLPEDYACRLTFMNLKKAVLILTMCLFGIKVLGQNDGFKPQIWNNASIGWISEKGFSLMNTFSYNVLLSQDAPWNEFSNAFSTAYTFNPYISVIGGFYVARTKQSTTLSSSELRPTLALSLSTNVENRWRVANNSKFVFSFLNYTDDSQDNTLRFRNRTLLTVAVKESNLLQDGSIVLFSYFEIFHNFEESTVERFFTTAKVKLGGRVQVVL
jgi:hypothetical protein